MRYPLVPLVTDLTCPLLFFWFSLPFVMLLVLMMIWLYLLLNEEVPSPEEIKKRFSDENDSDSKLEDEPTEEENQNDTSNTEMQEEVQPRGSLGNLRPKPAYLSSKPKSRKQSLPTAISDSCSQSQKISPSQAEKSHLCNIVMLLCTMLSSFTWNFACRLLRTSNVLMIQLLPSSLIIYIAQLFALGEKVVKTLGSLRLESRGLLASVLGRRYKRSGTE
ncbi:adipogenin isoform X2 [Cuculus canorus]|uniref:adipogenin isoform X2 n=1 Tax=Cuculus canorus TaxID=55661 RepID=UPI0023AA90F8|nr:adipogenin isoform X2 [Cuculus canorus]